MPTSAAAAPETPEISIDVTQDLDSLSDLRKLISAQGKTILSIGSEIAKFKGQQVSVAAASGTASVTLDLTATLPTWTAGVVSFSLKPEAKCKVTIAAKGEALPIAMKVDSTDMTDQQLAPDPTMTYINIDLDFDLSGSASGKGTVDGIAISGKASGAANTTLSFCQPVPSGTETELALQQAFSAIVFPTSPDCMTRMATGSSAKMNFDGTLNWEVDASYGLGDYKLSASNAAQVQTSIDSLVAQNITIPSAEARGSITASVRYAHSGQFGIVITKNTDIAASLYLVRSSSDEFDESLGASVGITVTKVTASVDSAKVQNTIDKVTGMPALSHAIANQVANEGNKLETAAVAKLNSWISDVNGSVGLSASLSQQKSRTALFNFTVDLTQADLATTWNNLLSSKVPDVRKIPGFTPMPGSGVSDQVDRSSTFQFNFFNFYKYANKVDYFNNCTAEIGADGDIHLVCDIGVADAITTNSEVDKFRIHFTGTATEDDGGGVNNADIDLNIELSEKGDGGGALIIAQVLSMMNQTVNLPSIQSAIDAMNLYALTNPGTLSLIATLKPSACARLGYSAYVNNKPSLNQTQDAWNWDAIHEAAVAIMQLSFVSSLSYTNWSDYSVRAGVTRNDRHALAGTVNPLTNSTFWSSIGIDSTRAPFVADFFVATASGLNLFEDLVTLAKDVANATTPAQWALIQKNASSIVKSDVGIDYSKAFAASVLMQVAHSGVQTAVTVAQASDNSTCTVTLTIA